LLNGWYDTIYGGVVVNTRKATRIFEVKNPSKVFAEAIFLSQIGEIYDCRGPSRSALLGKRALWQRGELALGSVS
jgi:hypothetical protein